MEERFGGTHQKIVKPHSSAAVASVDEVGKIYGCDLPSPHLLSLDIGKQSLLHR